MAGLKLREWKVGSGHPGSDLWWHGVKYGQGRDKVKARSRSDRSRLGSEGVRARAESKKISFDDKKGPSYHAGRVAMGHDTRDDRREALRFKMGSLEWRVTGSARWRV